MSVPFDGWPLDMPADVRALVDDLENGMRMVVVRRAGGCGCQLGTVKRVHGVDLLCVRRRALIYEASEQPTHPAVTDERMLTGDSRRARWQLDAMRLDDPRELVDVACQHGEQAALIYFDALHKLVDQVAVGERRQPATFLV